MIKRLVDAGELLITAGGGGVPVIRKADGTLEGLEAVIDKDLASALLAADIDAEALVILTAVDRVRLNFKTPEEKAARSHDPIRMRRRTLNAGQFPPGSMGPKIQAAINFLDHATTPGARVVIGAIEQLEEALAGEAGTTITAD